MNENVSDVSNLTDGADLPSGNNNNAQNQGKDGDTSAKAADDLAAKAKADADKAANDKAIADKAAADKLAAEELTKQNTGGAGKENTTDTDTAVEIAGVTYKLDKDGNALDDKGTIFRTKEQLAEMESDNEPAIVDVLIKKSGYVPLDDKGKPKIYEDTEDGIVQASLDIAKTVATTEFEKLIKSDPEFEEFVEYKKRGGNLRDFADKKTNSFTNVKLDENNENQLMNVIMSDLLATGMSEDQAKVTADMYKETKRLKEFGKAAYERLVTNEKQIEEQEKQEFEQRQLEYNTRIENHWKAVNETISKGALDTLVIPEAEKENFFRYISKAVDDKGRSQAMLDRNKLPLERSLQLDYFLFKGFDVSKLVTNTASTMRAKSLRDKIKNSASGAGGGEGVDTTKYQKSTTPNVTVDDLT